MPETTDRIIPIPRPTSISDGTSSGLKISRISSEMPIHCHRQQDQRPRCLSLLEHAEDEQSVTTAEPMIRNHGIVPVKKKSNTLPPLALAEMPKPVSTEVTHSKAKPRMSIRRRRR